MKTFKENLSENKPLYGIILTVASPEIAEITAAAGFDWLFIDLEHSPMSVGDAQMLMQAVAGKVHCVVRIPDGGEVWIKKCLDCGADGIIVPQVKSAAAAEDVVRFSLYPPRGERSVGVGRAHGYGPMFQEYVANANDSVAIIIQAEHIDAVREIDSIVRVPGIDAVFIGPYDLSASLGKIGQVHDPEVVNAIETVEKACKSTAVPLGIFGMTPDAVRPYKARGFRLLVAGIDTVVFGTVAGNLAADLKRL